MRVERLRLTWQAGVAAPRSVLIDAAAPVDIGRAAHDGVEIGGPWVPRRLATVRRAGDDWLVELGPSVDVHLENPWLSATVRAGAVVHLPRSITVLEYRLLDERLQLTFAPATDRDADVGRLRPRVRPGPSQVAIGTDYGRALARIPLTAQQRHRLAVLFRHLLEGGPLPDNVYAAADELGVTDDALKQLVRRVRRRLNHHRDADIDTVHDLGDYLAALGLITADDLAHRSGSPYPG